ncbi:ricin B-like lectin [Serendipita vermifera]|nr:ricin B-like lectin [Serendipita vermifera]
MQLKSLFPLLALVTTVVADPILQAPVNVPSLIQTFLVNPRFAPCLEAQGNWDGARVVTADCGNWHYENATWTAPKGGAPETGGAGPLTQLKIFGNKCLDVPNGGNWNGNKLQIWTCYDGNPNQLWQVNGDGTINWASHNKCLDLTDGNLRDPVVRTQIWTCGTESNPNFNQFWNFVPPRP